MTPTSIPAADNEQNLMERDRLVLQHLPLVRAIAIRVHENLPVHVDLDDLVHAGIMGLFDAAIKYDGEKQVTFRGYAKHRIKGAILDSLRDMDWASRDLRKRHKQLEAITRELAPRSHSAIPRKPRSRKRWAWIWRAGGRWRSNCAWWDCSPLPRLRPTAKIGMPPNFRPETLSIRMCSRARASCGTSSVVGDANSAGTVPDGDPALLHGGKNDAGDRRHARRQREPHIADSPRGPRPDGGESPGGRDSFHRVPSLGPVRKDFSVSRPSGVSIVACVIGWYIGRAFS